MSILFITGGLILIALVLLRLWGIISLRLYFTYFLKNPPTLLGFLGVFLITLGHDEYGMLTHSSLWLQVAWLVFKLFNELDSSNIVELAS